MTKTIECVDCGKMFTTLVCSYGYLRSCPECIASHEEVGRMAILSDERLAQLEKAERKLIALENGGVDNWDGYDFALEEIRKEDEYEEFLENVAGEILEEAGEHIEEPAGQGCGYGMRPQAYLQAAKILRKYKLPMQAIK